MSNYSSTSLLTPTRGQPSPSPASPRRASLQSALSFSPGGKAGGFTDLSEIVVANGATYLGVPLDRPLGDGFDATEEADKLRAATVGMGTRVEEVIGVLGDRTYPQIRAIDRAYQAQYAKSLIELVTSERQLKGNVLSGLKGLIMGPLNYDVHLLNKAVDSLTNSDQLLIELLVGRDPSSLALLRTAFSLRQAQPGGSPKEAKSLDEAVAAVCSANAKFRKTLEVALQGRWVDRPEKEDGTSDQKGSEEKAKLVKSDVDQLVVALRKGGNSDLVTKIVLARSPAHLTRLLTEYRKVTKTTLTKAIKNNFGAGAVRTALLHAVEGGKHDKEGAGVWRDAKLVNAAIAGVGTRNEALTYRLIRAHWDRPRFQRLESAYKTKYKHNLLKDVRDDTSAAFRSLLQAIVTSANAPDPVPTAADQARLEAIVAPRMRSRTPSVVSSASESDAEASVKSSSSSAPDSGGNLLDEPAPTMLEGDGELSNPGSPRQEKDVSLAAAARPGGSTPQAVHIGDQVGSNQPDPKSPPLTPRYGQPMSPSPVAAAEDEAADSVEPTLTRSTSAMDGRRSSLEFRSRTSPLEPAPAPGHRPRSSLGGSFDQLRKRPVAPARMKRGASEGPLMRSTSSSGSVEGRGTPSPSNARSPTPGEHDQFALHRRTSTPTQYSAPLPRSLSDASIALSTSGGGKSSTDLEAISTPASVTTFGSPPSSIDSTSYHPAPISPIGDIGASPSPLDSPTRFPIPGTNVLDYFDSPDRAAWIRRERSRGSLLSADSQIANVFAGEGGLGEGDAFQPDSWGYGHGRVGSAASASSADQFQALLRQTHELSRKLQESEARYSASASAYEQEQLELNMKLDEARAELQDKRRQEKDLRNNEKQHLAQIASLELSVEQISKSLERSRESYEGMKRQADDLRAIVAETRRETRQAEEAVQTHAAQTQHLQQENEILQQHVARLEAEILVTKGMQDELDIQKQDNLNLKETIDRLRFDLDEIHSTSKKASILAGGGNDSPAAKLTVSKSLGRELAQQLAEVEDGDSGGSEDEESGEEDEDIVVTTTRRVRKRGGNLRKSLEPVVTKHSTIVVEMSTQTDAVSMASAEIQTDLTVSPSSLLVPEPVQVVSIPFETQTERPSSPPPVLAIPAPVPSPQALREKLARDLGIELEQLERFVEKDNLEPSIPGSFTPPSPAGGLQPQGVYLPRRVGRWASRLSPRMVSQAPGKIVNAFPHGAQPLVAQILDSTVSFALYSAVLYLSGVLTGSVFFSPTITHIHPFGALAHHDTAAWHAFNQVPLGASTNRWMTDGTMGGPASGVGEAVQFWLNRLVWSGVSVVRRVPV